VIVVGGGGGREREEEEEGKKGGRKEEWIDGRENMQKLRHKNVYRTNVGWGLSSEVEDLPSMCKGFHPQHPSKKTVWLISMVSHHPKSTKEVLKQENANRQD
jgi:hypothetical protein